MLDNATLSDVIAKVKKLQALAGGSKNTNEVQAATAAADKLMQEYRVTQAQLEAAGENVTDPMHSVKIHSGGRRTAWREVLLWALGSHYGCTWYMNHGRHRERHMEASGRVIVRERRSLDYTIVGRESDCVIFEYMFDWLCSTIETLSKKMTRGQGVGYSRAWFDGAAQGVQHTFEKLEQDRRQEASTCSAMVLLDSRLLEAEAHKKKMNPDLTSVGSCGGGRDYNARLDGFAEGKKIQIVKGLKE